MTPPLLKNTMVLFSRPYHADSRVRNAVHMLLGYPHIGSRIRGNAVFKLFNVEKPANVLDIGCGSGLFSFELKKRGYDVVSMDLLVGVSQGDIKSLGNIFNKAGYALKFASGNAVALPFKDRTFNAVNIADVMEHIQDHDTAMKEIYRVLKDNGVMVASTPSTNFHRGKFKPFFRWLKDKTFLGRFNIWNEKEIYWETMMPNKRHVREYSLDDWKQLCQRSGFVLEDWQPEYKFFGALAIELYHSFSFFRNHSQYVFPFLYPMVLLDKFIPVRGTGIAVRCRKSKRQ